ncbi:hydrogenase nickel incorporation protein HypB [Accumulibacter sp.]|uniref:hydrogenase nickel incorporation protein HypB n=1 Tax=Accumulibacter sp. TaxID=2053492 RepID=UPI001A4FDC08|nr:hydrogenase nickel incorporation protein HypB [Accumulibacter sp.]MBL8373568.1 hydrogenase nickel incorporation protein HypB [Accumulibacter sp.]
MCTTCGCGTGETRVEGKALAEPGNRHEGNGGNPSPKPVVNDQGQGPSGMVYSAVTALGGHAHHHPGGRQHGHAHGHEHGTGHDHRHDRLHEHSLGQAATSVSTTQSRLVQIERDLLAKNDGYAAANRRRFEEQGIFALNLVSSPGSGKTTLLCRTVEALRGELSIAVIEGDQQTSRDAERIRATGAPAVQINTGKGCHLDAHMVGHALPELSPADDSLLLIENVGNLVCPAAFDLGEAHKVVILSVTEGEDKPLKYPNMFHAASLMLLNKVDLLPHLAFSSDLAISYARQINPALQVIQLSATTGEGFDQWLAWLRAGCTATQEQKRATMASLRRRIAELEARISAASGG